MSHASGLNNTTLESASRATAFTGYAGIAAMSMRIAIVSLAHPENPPCRHDIVCREVEAALGDAAADSSGGTVPSRGEPLNIGPYQITGELGRGAMAVVWLGYDPALDRHVAIKELIPPQNAAPDVAAEFADRFVLEARAVARLDHPGIVTIFAAGDFDGRAAIVMELLEGETLGRIIARGPVHPDSASVVVTQLLDAIGHAHSAGVIHRDIKPENVFVLPDGRVKLTDFGVAHFSDSGMTQIGTVIGTPGYMSPEQVMGLAVDARSDLFSLGVVSYELLTGVNPFGRTPELPVTTVMYRVAHEEVQDPARVINGIPRQMSDTVRVLLSKSPDERPVSAAQALRMWTGQERVRGASVFGFGRSKRPSTVPPLPPPVYLDAIPNSEATTISRPEEAEQQEPSVIAAEAVAAAANAPDHHNEALDTEQTPGDGDEAAAPAVDPETGELLSPVEPTSPESPAGRKRSIWIVPIAAALVIGVAVMVAGAMGGGGAARSTKPVTTTVPRVDTTPGDSDKGEATTTPTEPASPVDTSLSLKTSKSSGYSGDSAKLTATIKSDTNDAVSGSVVFESKTSKDGKWTTYKSSKISKGKAGCSVTIKSTRWFRARFKGSDGFLESVSSSEKITKKNRRQGRVYTPDRPHPGTTTKTDNHPDAGP